MKIMIFGYSGSGKSTLAEYIAAEYSLPILYIDKTLYNDNWERKTKEESFNETAVFLKKNNNWIIDGNGTNRCLFKERAELADKIIFMNFSRLACYKAAKNRYREYKNKDRTSRPNNCPEKFDLSFRWRILFGGRTRKRKAKFKEILKSHPEKIILIKNKKDVDYFKNNMDTLLLR